jgi:hypothetical protein
MLPTSHDPPRAINNCPRLQLKVTASRPSITMGCEREVEKSYNGMACALQNSVKTIQVISLKVHAS